MDVYVHKYVHGAALTEVMGGNYECKVYGQG